MKTPKSVWVVLHDEPGNRWIEAATTLREAESELRMMNCHRPPVWPCRIVRYDLAKQTKEGV